MSVLLRAITVKFSQQKVTVLWQGQLSLGTKKTRIKMVVWI